jgi:hypothetical protein
MNVPSGKALALITLIPTCKLEVKPPAKVAVLDPTAIVNGKALLPDLALIRFVNVVELVPS